MVSTSDWMGAPLNNNVGSKLNPSSWFDNPMPMKGSSSWAAGSKGTGGGADDTGEGATLHAGMSSKLNAGGEGENEFELEIGEEHAEVGL
jgi:hypothetical protein